VQVVDKLVERRPEVEQALTHDEVNIVMEGRLRFDEVEPVLVSIVDALDPDGMWLEL
jgi:hypothetical protein